MGTRHLIMVVLKKKTKVAQYGQWDGYPEGQGVGVLEFLRKTNLEDFRNTIKEVKFATKKQLKELDEQIKVTRKLPAEFSRDTSVDILDMIMNGGVRLVKNSEDFAKDSLFCEWAYVIDLDKNVLEVYEGFNTKPLDKNERFYGDGGSDGEYYPVRLVQTIDLNNIPTNEEFLELFKNEEKES